MEGRGGEISSTGESTTEFPECERSQAEGLKWTEIHCNWEQNVRREAEGGAEEDPSPVRVGLMGLVRILDLGLLENYK